ncbi:TPA: hypothetical protein ACS8BD_003695, partial [Providencia alcalifaciens]
RDGAPVGNGRGDVGHSSHGGASGEQGGNGVSGGNGQGGAAGNPGAVANDGINPVSPSANGAYEGVLLKDNLRSSELPSETVARGVGFDPAQALLSATRRALEQKDNQRSDEAKGLEQLRNALLPSSSTARHAALQRTSDVPEYYEQLNTLTNILQNHPGLERNRPVLQGFAMMLNRVSGLSEQTPSSPLLGAILAGLNVPAAGGNAANVSTVTETKNGDSNSALNAAASKLATALDVNTNQNSDLIGAAKQTMRATEEVLANLAGRSQNSSSALNVAASKLATALDVNTNQNSDLISAAKQTMRATEEVLANLTGRSQNSSSALNVAASKLATALDVNTNQNSDLISASKQTMRATEEVLGNLTGSSVLREATLRFTNNINIESSRHHDVVDATRKVLEKTQELLSKSTLSSDKSK